MPFDRFRLLLVDDDLEGRRVLKSLLETVFDVDVAADGSDAIAQLQAHAFSAVLTDLVMPNIDGVTLVRWIETNRPKLAPCTFVTTGGAVTARQKEFLETFDAERVFFKPFDAVIVISRVHTAIKR